jgi:YARHG domain
MKPSILSEVKNRVRKVLILAKVEKYIHVGNHWILETSGKALDHAHKATEVIKRAELEQYFQTGRVGVDHYLHQSKNWVLSTPERSLTEAYNAAQILKQIEDDHFTGTEVAAIANYSDSVSAYFQLVSKKYLLIIQVRLLEFRASYAIVDTSSFSNPAVKLQSEASTILEKLKFIDEILLRYQGQQANVALPRKDSGFSGKRTADMSEQEIRDQLRSQLGNQVDGQLHDQVDHQIGNHWNHWKSIDLLQFPFKKEEKSLDATLESALKSPSPAQPLQPHSNGSLNAGMASMLVAGGFAAGGVSTWAVLSVQNSLAAEQKQPPSKELFFNRASMPILHPSAIVSASQPERMPVESSRLAAKPPMPSSSPRSAPLTSKPKTATRRAIDTSPKKLLTLADLQGRNARELTILRNEIFARHGRRFKEPELQRYFKSQSWYQPRYSPHEFPIALLSKTEIQNAILIRDYQRAHGLE